MEYSQPKSAYVHVPFCRHRCGYCNFSVVAGRDDLIDDYLAAMQAELSLLGAPRTVATIFLGGGTPTHLDSYSLARLLDMIGEWLPLSSGGEYSCEANPEDISSECIRPLADAGVNRISLGVQSFQAKKLRVLERAHDAKIAARAIQVCRDHGMDVSIDLIFGAPANRWMHGELIWKVHWRLSPITSRRMGSLSNAAQRFGPREIAANCTTSATTLRRGCTSWPLTG